MNEAHKLLPNESTLHHQMGQLYYNSMKLTKERWLGEKQACVIELIQLAKNASECFDVSRSCELNTRLDKWVPWKSDVQCRVECLSYICELMDCKYLSQLPESLTENDFIQNVEEETCILLDTLQEYDPYFHSTWSSNLSNLMRTKPDCNKLVDELFEEIHSDMSSDKKRSAQNRKKLARKLKKISYIWRVQMFNSGRQVPIEDVTKFTKMLYSLIDLRTGEYEENFFELELFWNWSRFSSEKISTTVMLGIIERYLQNVSTPELKARCKLFQGVVLLLRHLSGELVEPESISKSISDCCEHFKQNKSDWRQREFIIHYTSQPQLLNLLSFKDWNPHYRLVHLLLNDNKALNLEYEERKHIRPVEFSGNILPFDDEVHFKGLRFAYKKKKVPDWWRESRNEVKFFIAISSRDGLQAFAAYPLEEDKRPVSDHVWPLGRRTTGLIVKISGNQIHFGPPNKDKPYKHTAFCLSRDLTWQPKEGDLCEFIVRKDINGTKPLFEAYDIILI